MQKFFVEIGSLYAGEPIVAPVLVSATIEQLTQNVLTLEYDIDLDETAVPNVSAYSILGKTVSSIAVSGKFVSVTISGTFEYGDRKTVTYTIPISNGIRSLSGGLAASFTNQIISNHIEYPAILESQTEGVNDTWGWWDPADLATVTKDGSELIETIADKLSSGHNITESNSSLRPVYANASIHVTSGSKRLRTAGSQTIGSQVSLYMAVNTGARSADRCFCDGITNNSFNIRINSSNNNNISIITDGDFNTPTSDIPLENQGQFILRIEGNKGGSYAAGTLKSNVNNGPVTSTATYKGNPPYNIDGFCVNGIGSLNGYGFTDAYYREIILRKVVDSEANKAIIYKYIRRHNQVAIPSPNSYWKFDDISGNAVDSRSVINGVPSGTITYGAASKFGRGFQFGDQSGVLVNPMSYSSNFSVCLWAKRDTLVHGACLLSFSTNYNGIFVNEAGDISITNTLGNNIGSYPSIWTDKSSHHLISITVIVGSPATIIIYFDAVPIINLTTENFTSISRLLFGNLIPLNDDYNFLGIMSDCEFWNSFLTWSQIEAVYREGDGNQYPHI